MHLLSLSFSPRAVLAIYRIGQHRQRGETSFPTSHSLPASQLGNSKSVLGQNDGEHTPGSIHPGDQPQNPGVPRGASAHAIILGKLNRQLCTSNIPLLFRPPTSLRPSTYHPLLPVDAAALPYSCEANPFYIFRPCAPACPFSFKLHIVSCKS